MARVNEGSHSFTCHLHTFIHNWNEPYMPLFSSLTASPVLTFRLAEGRRLSSSGRSVTLVSHAKTAEAIEMPLGLRTQVDPRNHVLGGPHPHWRDNFRGGASHCKQSIGTLRSSVKKTAEPIEIPFGLWLGWAQRIVLDGVQIPHGKGNYKGKGWPIV